MHKKFYSVQLFNKKKIEKLHFSHIVKKAADYTKIDRVDSLDAGFQKVLLVQKF